MKRPNYLDKTNAYRRLATLLFLFSHVLIYAQPGDRPPNAEPNACYEKVTFPDEYEIYDIAVPIYIGDDKTIIKKHTRKEKITLLEAHSRWVQKVADRNCISKNPEKDCMVWCLVEEKAKVVKLDKVVIDTSITQDYDWEYFTIKKMMRKGGYSDWIEVLCSSDITNDLINSIRSIIGIPQEDYNFDVDAEMRNKLVEYQKENDLPLGYLDYMTLEHMGLGF